MKEEFCNVGGTRKHARGPGGGRQFKASQVPRSERLDVGGSVGWLLLSVIMSTGVMISFPKRDDRDVPVALTPCIMPTGHTGNKSCRAGHSTNMACLCLRCPRNTLIETRRLSLGSRFGSGRGGPTVTLGIPGLAPHSSHLRSVSAWGFRSEFAFKPLFRRLAHKRSEISETRKSRA